MKSSRHNKTPHKIVNRRARHDYELGDSFVVGVVLSGRETKALRLGHGQLRGSYVTIKEAPSGGELWLINSTITSTGTFTINEVEQTRARKLLAKRREIEAIIAAKKQGQTVVPLEFLTSGRYIKLRIAIGRGKKLYDKRMAIKKKDQSREEARNFKH